MALNETSAMTRRTDHAPRWFEVAPKAAIKEPTTIAQTPFNNEAGNADLILRTSDQVDFYVHKLLLRMASSFFTDMFTVACEEKSTQPVMSSRTPSLPVVDVQESSSTINSILRICYPVDEVSETSLDKVADILEVALKYEIPKAISRMKKELLGYVSTNPISVYAKACALGLEFEACQAAVGWRTRYDTQEKPQRCTSCGYLGVQWEPGRSGWQSCHNCGVSVVSHTHITFINSVGGRMCREDMRQCTAGHLHRLIQFVISGVHTTFSSSPQNSSSSDGSPLLPDYLRDNFPFIAFPDPDITIQSIDHVDLPTHTSILTYASASDILKKKGPVSSVICLDEDGRTLATLLQLCYPFADSDVTVDNCPIPLTARVRKTAEKYGMPTVAQAAKRLMSQQIQQHPLDAYFSASRYGWQEDARLAEGQCESLTWKDIEGPNAYTMEMEFVSAEVYFNLLKRWYEARPVNDFMDQLARKQRRR